MALNGLRPIARDAADRLGLGRQARRVRDLAQSKSRRRNQRDDEQLKRLIALALRSDDVAVDVGANVGAILDAIVRAAPDATHVAFEPVPSLARELRSRFPGVDVRESATANEAGRASFTVVADHPSRSGLAPAGISGSDRVETIDTEVVRLDDVLAGRAPRLLKVDVEGGELATLRGAAATIARGDVMVAFEHGHGLQLPDIDEHRALSGLLMVDLGLRTFDLDGVEFSRAELERVYLDGSRWNFLARR